MGDILGFDQVGDDYLINQWAKLSWPRGVGELRVRFYEKWWNANVRNAAEVRTEGRQQYDDMHSNHRNLLLSLLGILLLVNFSEIQSVEEVPDFL